jgi:hypothetical protein
VTQPIRDHLDDFGPITSGQALRMLADQGVGPEAARKRLERLGSDVQKLQRYGLPQNQALLYLKKDWLSPRFKDVLVEAWRDGNSSHLNALAVVAEDGTPCPTRLFASRSGAPIALKKQVSGQTILDHLKHLEFVNVREVPALGECVMRREATGSGASAAAVRATLLAESIVIDALRDWLRKVGLSSYEAGSVRSDDSQPDFASHRFDFVSPSYARPLAMPLNGQLKPGFVVGDVWLGETLDTLQIAGFVRKTTVIRANPRNRPFLSFLIADRFSPRAFRLGKEQGLLFTTPELMFGTEISAAIRRLVSALTDAADAAIADPSVVPDLFKSLGRIEGAAMNLRGPLFELIVGYILGAINAGPVEIGRMIKAPDEQRAEIDIIQRGPDVVRLCECRGHQHGREVQLEEVKAWRETRVPRWRAWVQAHPDLRDLTPSFEYWTTGTFDDASASYLAAEATKTKKYPIKWFGGDDIIAMLKRTKAKRLVETLREHYLAHPLNKVVGNAKTNRAKAGQPSD